MLQHCCGRRIGLRFSRAHAQCARSTDADAAALFGTSAADRATAVFPFIEIANARAYDLTSRWHVPDGALMCFVGWPPLF